MYLFSWSAVFIERRKLVCTWTFLLRKLDNILKMWAICDETWSMCLAIHAISHSKNSHRCPLVLVIRVTDVGKSLGVEGNIDILEFDMYQLVALCARLSFCNIPLHIFISEKSSPHCGFPVIGSTFLWYVCSLLCKQYLYFFGKAAVAKKKFRLESFIARSTVIEF